MSPTKLVACNACVYDIATRRFPVVSSTAPVMTLNQVSAVLVATFLESLRYLISGCVSDTVIVIELFEAVPTIVTNPPVSVLISFGNMALLERIVIKLVTMVDTLIGSLNVRIMISSSKSIENDNKTGEISSAVNNVTGSAWSNNISFTGFGTRLTASVIKFCVMEI